MQQNSNFDFVLTGVTPTRSMISKKASSFSPIWVRAQVENGQHSSLITAYKGVRNVSQEIVSRLLLKLSTLVFR